MAAAAAAATAMGEGEETRQRRKKKKLKPSHVDLGLAPSQSPRAPAPLPAGPFLETPAQSPAPGTPILEEAAAEEAMRKRKMRKEQKVAALPLAPNPTLEEQGEEPVLATKKKHKERRSSPSLSAAEIPILEQEAKVTKKRKPSKEQEPSGNSPLPLDPGQTQSQGTKVSHASKPLLAAPFLEAPAQCPAPGTSMLEDEAAATRKRRMRKEQKVTALPLAQNPTLEEQAEEPVLTTTTTKKKHKERNKSSLSPSASAAAETPILEQEVKVTKKRKRSTEQEPSGYLQLPLGPGQTQSQATKATHAPKPLSAAPFREAPAQSPAPGTPMLEEAAVAVMMKRKNFKEQKAVAPSLAKNTTLEEQRDDTMAAKMKKKSKHMKHALSSPSTSFAAETTIWEQEVKVTKKRKHSKDQEPSGYSPLPPDPGQTQSQGTKAPHASKPLLAAPFREAPAQSLPLGTPMLEEAAAAVMRKRKICKQQKAAAPSLAQHTTLEEQRDDTMAAKMKEESKHMKHTLSAPCTSFAAETTIWEQEVKVTKKRKHSKDQEPSGYSPLPLDPRQTQSHGTKAPHASKPLLGAPSRKVPAQSPALGTPMLEEAATVVMKKRKICKEQKVAAVSLAQNTTLEEQREDAMAAKMKKEPKHMEHTLSSSTFVAAKTTIWEQEAKVTKKQKQRKQQEPSGKSPLPLDPGQTQCVRSQGGKAPPEQEREADARTGSSIKKNNGKRPSVRVLSKRELIKEASKKQPPPLPEGFVAFSDFVSSCTEKNPDHSPPYSAFFDQFRYNPVREDHKPPLPRTPVRLASLPPRGHSSLESSQLTANETSRAFKSNTSVASKTKQLDSGSGSQEKLNVEVKETPQKKTREKKQRKPSGNSLPFDPSQTCCGQLQGTKAPPEQYQEANAPKVDNIKNSNGKKARVPAPSKCELFKEMNKEQMLPEGFWAPSDFVPNCTEQNPNCSSPSDASFYQFCSSPSCQDHNPQPPGTTDHLSMLPPRGYPPFELSELSANGTSKASKAKNSVARKSKKKDSSSGSASGSQEKLHAKEKKNPEKKMGTKKQREPPPLLTRAEKCSDKYRRVPLDQLVPPPCSPHNLLQEKYASDPWKVIVICMLLNLTQGKQVKNIIDGFFECYPDAHSAFNADPEKMAGYLAPLGLQRVKTSRIQTFSKEYVEKEWTHITELCGVGKYAADAYAIFCAGRATEVVPKDHKLVDYWKYVCFELPMMQESQNVQEAVVSEQELAVIC